MSDISKFIRAHREALQQTDNLLTDKTAHSPLYHVSIFNHDVGRGFSDIYDFGRVCVSRGNFQLNHDKQLQNKKSINLFGFTIFIQGIHCIKNEITGEKITIRPPQIALRKGITYPHSIELSQHRQMSIISLDFDKDILKKFAITEDQNDFLRFFSSIVVSDCIFCDINDQRIIHHAEQLLRIPPVESYNELELLHLEGEALGLLSLLLQGDNKFKTSVPTEISNAISILEHEFDKKITIPLLSKRVGMNECDLKRKFKLHTHFTIADYLLQQRMNHAIKLLAKGNPIQEVAYKVGYGSTQYFKQVFFKYFGYEPKNQ